MAFLITVITVFTPQFSWGGISTLVTSSEVRGVFAAFRGGRRDPIIEPMAWHEASPQELVICCEIRATQAGTISMMPYGP